MDVAWAIFAATVSVAFFAGGAWYETRRTSRVVERILEKIEPIPVLKDRVEVHEQRISKLEAPIGRWQTEGD